MRKLVAAILTAIALFLFLAPAAEAAKGGAIKVTVLDATCAGPCRVPPPSPPPYTGPGLTVTVRHVRDGRLVAKRHPTDGRVRVSVPAGRYRVAARVGPDRMCWPRASKAVGVDAREVARVRLRVRNACIV